MTLVDQPTQLEILDAASKRALNSVHKAMPGVVKSYDPLTQTAEIELAVQLTKPDGSKFTMPPLTDVPVMFPRGGGFAVTFPLESGDGVLLVFTDEDYAKWFVSDSVPSEPAIEQRHGMYPYAIPGAFSLPNVLLPTQAKSDAAMLAHSSGMAVKLESGGIQMGDLVLGSLDFVALAAKVETQLQTIVDAIKGGVPVANDGGVALQNTIVALLTDPVGSVAASKVEAT